MSKLFTILLFSFVLLAFSSNVLADEDCFGAMRIDFAPNETKSFGDVTFETYEEDRHSGKGKKFEISYENQVLNLQTAKSCHRLKFNLWFANTGEKVEKPDSITLYFTSNSTYRTYGWKSSRIFKVFDSNKFLFSKNLDLDRRKGKPFGNSIENYEETISTDISFERFKQMANAEILSFYLGKSKVKITDKDINAIKEIVKFIDNIE